MTYSFRIVIAVSGQSPRLSQTLQSLSECSFPESYEGLQVVENGPKSNIEEIVISAPNILQAKYLYFAEANKSAALNHAFSFLSNECFVYLTDDDICFSRSTLINIERAGRGKTKGVVAGGELRVDHQKNPPEWMLRYVPYSMRGWSPAHDELSSENLRFLGANWAVFAGDVHRVGGFDPRFGPGSPLRATGQETQMQRLLRRDGAKFQFVDNAEVTHYVESGRFNPSFIADRHFRVGVESGIRTAIAPWDSMISVLRTPYRLLSNSIKLVCSVFLLGVLNDKSSPSSLSALTVKNSSFGFFKGFFSIVTNAIPRRRRISENNNMS